MLNDSLDLSQNDFKDLLDHGTSLVLKQFENLEERKGFHDFSQEEVASWFDEALPENGMPVGEVLAQVESKVLNTATGNLGPHMYAYVMAGGNQVGIVADMLASTINQNVAKWHLAPAITEIDKRIVQWAADLVGFGGPAGGFLVSSGSAANFDGLTVARNVFFEKLHIKSKGLFGMKPFTVYCSDETHSCIDKSVQMLGIGTDHLRKIDTHADFTIDLKALEQQIKVDMQNGLQPFCLIGNAGTVNTGAIDDLEALALLAKKYELWFHVDGAYGGLASALDSIKHHYKGIEEADSLALDFHKWLYQPFEVGCLLVRGWDKLRNTYYQKADYLLHDASQAHKLQLNEHHFLLSRNAKSLKVWMTLKTYGVRKIRAMIQKDIDLTQYLTQQIEAADDFRLVATDVLAISCFQYTAGLQEEDRISELTERLLPALEKDGRVFITGTRLKGELVLRACLINHRKSKETTDFLLEVIREVGWVIHNSEF